MGKWTEAKWKTVLKSDQSKIESLFGKPEYIPQTYEERDPLVYYWGNIRSHPDDVQTRSNNKQKRWILKLDSAEACLMPIWELLRQKPCALGTSKSNREGQCKCNSSEMGKAHLRGKK